MKKLLLVLTVVLSALVFTPSYALAQPSTFGATSSQEACEALKDLNPEDKGCGAANSGVNSIIRTAIQLLSIVAGVIAVIMIIVAGLKYITSEGDAAKAASARQSLIYAIIGMVVVVMAQVFVRFILGNLN